jgi:iron uptake system EfeUOB component EfeO/EfeM
MSPLVPFAVPRPALLVLAVLGAAAIALVATALVPSGGGHHAMPVPAISKVVVGNGHPRVAPIDAKPSAQSTADAAAQTPTAGGLRSEVDALPVKAFHGPVAAYRRYAIKDARAMAAPAAAITARLRAGDRSGAEAAWGQAYDKYLLLGAAYGALGTLDAAIDGGSGGQPLGTRDPHFTGLHRVEHDLWTGRPLASIVPFARRLERDTARLPRKLAKMEIPPLDYATRAHEILEDAQRDQLSDVAAPWSGAGLRATADDLQATRTVMATLHPILSGRGDVLIPVNFYMKDLGKRLSAVSRAHHGRWPAVSAMTQREHASINGSLGALLEALSGVPGDLETQLPPAVPAIPKTTTKDTK